jgi:hypothetical protein
MTDLEQDLYIANARIKELEAESARLKESNRWIPVTERLPEDKQLCLCVYNLWDKTPVIDVFEFRINPPDIWCSGENSFWDYDSESGYFERNDVTHWRPLPEPPKEGAK